MTKYILLSFMFTVANSFAGDTTYVDTNSSNDTLLYRPPGVEDYTETVTDTVDYERKLTQNPTVALFKSMIVPGLGQIGNKSYIKAGVVIGLQTWLISSAVSHGKDADDLKSQFDASTDIAERNFLYDKYLDSKDQRNKFTWFAVIVTFVSMFDAYTDAHLSGFPVEKDESSINLKISPQEFDGVYASVSYSF